MAPPGRTIVRLGGAFLLSAFCFLLCDRFAIANFLVIGECLTHPDCRPDVGPKRPRQPGTLWNESSLGSRSFSSSRLRRAQPSPQLRATSSPPPAPEAKCRPVPGPPPPAARVRPMAGQHVSAGPPG